MLPNMVRVCLYNLNKDIIKKFKKELHRNSHDSYFIIRGIVTKLRENAKIIQEHAKEVNDKQDISKSVSEEIIAVN